MSAIGFSSLTFRSRRHVLPGFGFSLGFTLFYLTGIVLVPLLALVIRPFELGFHGFWAAISTPRVLGGLAPVLRQWRWGGDYRFLFWFYHRLGAGALSLSRQGIVRRVD